MSNKTFISTILFFAFSFLLAHNIIPHHHHDEVSDLSHHEHHHDNQGHQNKNDEPIGLFSHLTHFITTTEFQFTFSNNYDFQKTQILKQFIENTDFVFRQLKIPIKPKPPNYIFIPAKQSFYSTHSLRGPPVLSV